MSETGKPKKKKIRFSVILMIFILLCYICAGTGVYVFVHKQMEGAPELNVRDFIGQEMTNIYDCNGTLLQEIGAYMRDNVPYDELPECVIDAFLAIEDSRYFEHRGFDIPRLMRSAYDWVRTGDAESGASTFTMQLVKNTYFSIENGEQSTERVRSLTYKIQQIILSAKLERYMNKEEILQLYLNKVNFGKNIRGIQKASEYYFGKDVRELNTSEAALLAGIVNLPNLYNPYAYLDYSTRRRDTVLRMMEYHGYITTEEKELAERTRVEDLLVGEDYMPQNDYDYQSYIDVVIEEALALTGKDPILTGMNIYTAMNPQLQDTVELLQNGFGGVVFPDPTMQTAIVCMDNRTGELAAIGGGGNYSGSRMWNRASQMYKQPGSSVKPVLSYALAFEYLGYTTSEILVDRPLTLPSQKRILVNATGYYQGDVSIKEAVARSLNIPAISVLEDVTAKIGAEAVVDYMKSLGFRTVSKDNYDLLWAIGGNEFTVTPMQLAGAHGAMINLGVYNKPHTIRRITTSDSRVYEPDTAGVRVLSSGSAWLSDQLMQYNVESGIFNYMQDLVRDYPVYAKTGTTDWGDDGLIYGIPRGAAKDKWMVASTSQFTNVVWVGWDQAVAGGNNYFSAEYSKLNIPGRLQEALLYAEEPYCDDSVYDGVLRPEDVDTITYISGTYPHVQFEEGMDEYYREVGEISLTGLQNSPRITKEGIDEESFKGLLACRRKDQLSIQWNVIPDPCSGSRNISLIDNDNYVSAWGRCMYNLSWLYSPASVSYTATVYVNGSEVETVNSDISRTTIDITAGENDEIKVCGNITRNGTPGKEACITAWTQTY
ncbi:MAG: penicillin-binding protein [Solobacterium sp.]|nr:penicillin-binding protein [Solobacterium sp.]